MRVVIFNTFFLLCVCTTAFAQNTKFRNSDDIKKMSKGDVVEIVSDSAYVISGQRADAINQKVYELDSIKSMYNRLAKEYNQLHEEIESVRGLLVKLSQQMENDTTQIGERFDEILGDLNNSLTNLKENNKELKKSNKELLEQTEQLKQINKDLKKETRNIWWNGMADKIVAFAGGVGVGLLLVVLL